MKLFKIPYCFTVINNTAKAILKNKSDADAFEMKIRCLVDKTTADKHIEMARKDAIETAYSFNICLRDQLTDVREKLISGEY